MRSLLRSYATGFGIGFFPIAPGTAGSLLALALYCWLPVLPLGAGSGLGPGPVVFLAVLAAIGVPASREAEREFGEDGSPIVVDEIVGQWVTVAGLVPTPAVVVGGFLLFRGLDIFKPFPAGRSQRWGGGWGVMADDLFAGLYAAIVLRLLLRILPGA